jgi:hypothetical protein
VQLSFSILDSRLCCIKSIAGEKYSEGKNLKNSSKFFRKISWNFHQPSTNLNLHATKSLLVNELERTHRSSSQHGIFWLGCFPNLFVHPGGKRPHSNNNLIIQSENQT